MLLTKLLRFKLFYHLGWPKTLPVNLTLSITTTCNSRCQTCNIWQKKENELTIQEWEKILKNIGPGAYWVTISGGEPFLSIKLEPLIDLIIRYLKPKIITLPTNGLLTERISEIIKRILAKYPSTKFIINLSLDAVGAAHNQIRGVAGNYEQAIKTYAGLKKLKDKNLTLGIGTVISNFNVKNFPAIYDELIKLRPDSYVTEIAEERGELDTFCSQITPVYEDYCPAINYLMTKMNPPAGGQKISGLAKITRAFRLVYYELVKNWLKNKKQIIPCYAGLASAQISATGEVWTCCILAQNILNLREADYDFKKVWFSRQADHFRKFIKNKKCHCPLANVAYTNILLNPKSLIKVIYFWLRY